MSRRAINYLNYLYPDAREDELNQGDNVCIICREEMTGVGAKKLPCNHIFHAACLRSWFQRQQTCPTCRLDIIQATVQQTVGGAARQPANQQQPPAAAAPQAQQAPLQQQAQAPAGHVPNLAAMFPFIPPGFMPHGHAHAPQQQPQPIGTAGVRMPTASFPPQMPTTNAPMHMNAPPFLAQHMMPPMMPFSKIHSNCFPKSKDSGTDFVFKCCLFQPRQILMR